MISSGIGLLFSSLALANMIRGYRVFTLDRYMLWPAALIVFHAALMIVLWRGRWLTKLIGIVSGLVIAVSGWSAFATVGAPAPGWLGTLGLVCFFAGPALFIANLCVAAFAQPKKTS